MSTRKDVIVVGAGVIGCSIAYHLGRRRISARIVERESIATRASGKAWAVFTCAPSMLVSEEAYTVQCKGIDGDSIDLAETPPDQSIEDWLYLHSASCDRMPEFAIELAERGGDHTSTPVEVYAYGPGAEQYDDITDNTQIGQLLFSAVDSSN